MIGKLALAAALAALPLAASAADMTVAGRAPVYQKAPPAPSTYSWTGLYLTGNVNYSADFAGSNVSLGAAPLDFNTIPHGFGAGGGLRALWQLNGSPWVIGLDTDLNWLSLRSSANAPTTAGPLGLSSATNWIGDVDGLLGLALGPDQRLLGAVLGGASCGGVNGNLSIAAAATAASSTSCGWNAGAMLDYALTDNIGIFIKGKYTDLGSKQLNLGAGVFTSNVRYQDITQELGFTFKFF